MALNHFARLGFEPRPWLEQELLKQRFIEFSAQVHPDKAAATADKSRLEEEFKALNESFNILRSTRSRLLHLLELSGFPKQEHVQNVPPEVLEFFAEINAATKGADLLIKEKAGASSPMLKVQLMDRTLEGIDALQLVQAKVRQSIAALEEKLKSVSERWQSQPDGGTTLMLAQSAAALGFLERWNAQLQEKIAALTF